MNKGGDFMNFSQKLDYLMNLTKTTNSSLAFYTSLDASYISRLRNGKRQPAKSENYIKKMSEYFEKKCNDNYDKAILINTLCIDKEEIKKNNPISKHIYKWLLNERNIKDEKMEGFSNNFSNYGHEKHSKVEDEIFYEVENIEKYFTTYFGREGKRKAVIAFLSLVIESNSPGTILLYSDENMDWLTEDKEFAMKWVKFMVKVISRGNKIIIIHTLSRNLDEMLSAISKWIPLYMTGSIEPYYYPKKRDGIFKRTLFVAKNIAAVTSSSVIDREDDTVNFLFRDKKITNSLSCEFEEYLSFCRPLIKIFTQKISKEYMSALWEFDKEKANAIIKSGTMSISSMSIKLMKKIIERTSDKSNEKSGEFYESSINNMLELLKTNTVFEIVKIPDESEIEEGKFRIALNDGNNKKDFFYSVEEYKEHLRNIIYLMETYDNYNICISCIEDDNKSVIYIKEYIGAIVVKATFPQLYLAVNEGNVTGIIWDYLIDRIKKEKKRDRDSIIKELKGYLE